MARQGLYADLCLRQRDPARDIVRSRDPHFLMESANSGSWLQADAVSSELLISGSAAWLEEDGGRAAPSCSPTSQRIASTSGSGRLGRSR